MAYQPQFPYEGRQIIIDSGRVTLNSKDDTTFLLGKEAVSISSGGTVNIDSNGDFLLNSPKIYFGLKTEDTDHEPLVLGFKLSQLLNDLAVSLGNIAEDLKETVDSNGAPILQVQTSGIKLLAAADRLSKAIKTMNSNKSFTL
jgi:hypothetical protein